MTVIEVSGADAESFLQRQLTSDVSEVTSERAQFAAYLNPKGRVIANFILIMRHDKYYLVVNRDVAELLSNRLKLYVLRAKVTIECRTDMAFCGCRNAAADSDPTLPKTMFESKQADAFSIIRMPGIGIRYGMLTELNHIDATRDPSDSDFWLSQDLEAGIPWISEATCEELIAQAINLDLLGAVSWTKGCYPGQEIVARLHYRGGVNRRLVPAWSCVEANPVPGDRVTGPNLSGDQSGTVVNALIQKSHNQAKLLVSVPIKFFSQKKLLLADQHPLHLMPENLPYLIPEL